jgi:DNA-binding transcriptional LysR family regulator
MSSRLHAYIGTFRQLEILLAVYVHGSITAATEALHLTQPTISMQLKKLSDAIGLPIYDQVGKKLVFTEAGIAAVNAARDILARFEDLEIQLSDFKGLKAGTLRLGIVTTAKYFIPHLLGEFCKLYPAIDVQMNVANRGQILERLERGEDDFYVFSHPPETDEIELFDFLPNPLVAIAPLGHPMTQKGKITLAEFAQYPFLMREPGSGTRYAIEEHMKKYGIKLNLKMTIESNEAIRHAVMAGLGVSILSSHTLSYGGHVGLQEINVSRIPIVLNWQLARLKSKRMSIIASTFLDYVNTQGRAKLLQDLSKEQPHMQRFFAEK